MELGDPVGIRAAVDSCGGLRLLTAEMGVCHDQSMGWPYPWPVLGAQTDPRKIRGSEPGRNHPPRVVLTPWIGLLI